MPPSPNEKAPAATAPAIEREALVQKLNNIPIEALRNILSNQVDLEIRLKHKELKLTEEEIGKCEAQMLALRNFLEVPSEVTFRSEPNDFTLKYYDILNKSLSVSYTRLQQIQFSQENPQFKENIFTEGDATHSYRTRSTTSSLRPSVGGPAVRIAGCLYRRTDGIIVKLTCPDCHRSNFSSAQGFLNHSRIAHSKEYTSQDAAALSCGEVLSDEYQDEEGLASLAKLRSKSIDLATNLNINEIYFTGLSRSLNTVHRGLSQDLTAKVNEDSSAAHNDPKYEESETHELMKKLIKNGVTPDAESFNAMVREMRQTDPRAHLFDDEEEEEEIEVKEEAKNASEPSEPSEPNESGERRSRRGSLRDTKPDVTRPELEHRLETGGKYENRLRRRKSRGDMRVEGAREEGFESGEERRKKKKSQK